MGRKRDPRERFEERYIPEPNSGCWLWTAGLGGRGYAQLRLSANEPPIRAHIFAYKLFNGEVPPGMVVRHTCDVRSCVNPDHLLLGTSQDNVHDAVSRHRHPKGERHGAAKLTEEHVRLIRMCSDPAVELATEFGVSDSLITAIRKRRKWKHVA